MSTTCSLALDMSNTEANGRKPWKFAQRPDALSLDIAIIGAGIAGLTAAAALSRVGHNVEIFERSHFKDEVGAAIGVSPNITGILGALDFDFERARAVVNLQVRSAKTLIWDGHNFTKKLTNPCHEFPEKYGSWWYMIHRADLHAELKHLALSPPEDIKLPKLRLGSPIVSVDCEGAVLTLADGTTAEKDLIVGADGGHSTVAKSILGSDVPPFAISDQSAFRFLVPTEVLRKNELTNRMVQENTMNVGAAPDRRLIFYPCRSNELYNFVALHPTRAEALEDKSWQGAGNISDLVETYKEFHPSLVEACRLAEDLKLWKLKFRPPVKTWTKGKTIMIGDAAHPMLPHHAQAGNMAIEDAGALAMLLSNVHSIDEIPRRLELVQNVRRDRASALQIFSNSAQDDPDKVEVKVRPFVQGPIPKNPKEFGHFIYGYDLLAVVEKALLEV